MRYVLALLLIRRRVVRLEETERDDNGCEMLVLYCPRRETTYRVAVAAPNDERTTEIQHELAGLLFAGRTDPFAKLLCLTRRFDGSNPR